MGGPCGLERLVLCAREELEEPSLVRRARTQGARGTRRTILGTKTGWKPGITAGVARFPPRQGPLALRTANLFSFPVYDELIVAIGPGHLGLPPRLRARGADQRNMVILGTTHQEFRINIPRIDDMLAREQFAFAERGLSERSTL